MEAWRAAPIERGGRHLWSVAGGPWSMAGTVERGGILPSATGTLRRMQRASVERGGSSRASHCPATEETKETVAE